MKKFKILMAVVVVAIFAISILSYPKTVLGSNNTVLSEIIIDSIFVSNTGHSEVIGHFSNPQEGDQVTCIVMTDGATLENSGTISGDTVLWIDQMYLGNNGTFLIEFNIHPKFSKKEVVYHFGGTNVKEVETLAYTLPELPPNIDIVADNSVMYGKDVYTLDSIYLTGEYVADSIVYGGNIIYFKFGGNWYNLLDKRATSNLFLIEQNAEKISDMRRLPLRYYYNQAQKAVFAEV